MVWFGEATLAVMLAITSTVLLYFKAELHGISKALTPKDLLSILQFGVLSLIILPILPDQDFGPYAALNPRQIWWMVVLISGLSLAGYAALCIVGVQHGAPLLGIFGGLASSTATTLVFARHARDHEGMERTATIVILLANLVVLVRLGAVAVLLAPTLLGPLFAVFGCGLVSGVVALFVGWRTLLQGGELPMPQVGNPTEIRTALGFGVLYALVLVVSSALQDFAGSRGLFVVALASGLTDVDAITLSTLRLHTNGTLLESVAVTAIGLAVIANLAFKSMLVFSIGGQRLARNALPGLGAIGLGLVAGLLGGSLG